MQLLTWLFLMVMMKMLTRSLSDLGVCREGKTGLSPKLNRTSNTRSMLVTLVLSGFYRKMVY